MRRARSGIVDDLGVEIGDLRGAAAVLAIAGPMHHDERLTRPGAVKSKVRRVFGGVPKDPNSTQNPSAL
jgi:hypothetical protein